MVQYKSSKGERTASKLTKKFFKKDKVITMAKKMTIVEQYEAIIGKCEGILSAEELGFLRERAELHAKKNATRGQTATQKENEVIKEKILEKMEVGKSYTATEIQKLVGLESFNKATALVGQLKKDGLVVRSEIKGKAYFTLVISFFASREYDT